MKWQEISHKLGQKAFQLREKKKIRAPIQNVQLKGNFRKEERNYTPQTISLFLPIAVSYNLHLHKHLEMLTKLKQMFPQVLSSQKKAKFSAAMEDFYQHKQSKLLTFNGVKIKVTRDKALGIT